MSQFYIANQKDLLRCRSSMEMERPLLVTGITIDGHRKTFRGTVQSIDEDAKREDGFRFKITLRGPN